MTTPGKRAPSSWGWLLLGCILFGVAIRFAALESLVYWHDEAYTALRIAGSTAGELHDVVFSGAVVSVDDLLTYQRLREGRGLSAMMQSLIVEDVQHPPLYYVLVWIWAQLFGSSIWAVRSLSALTGVLVLPAAGWLGQALFQSQHQPLEPAPRWLTSGLFVALVAVSPYQMLYAQEAREYVLWTLTTLLSSAALLRSLRLNTAFSWTLYALTLTVGLYTHLFTVLTGLGHGLYSLVVIRNRGRGLVGLISALAATGLLFLPWLRLVLNPDARQGASWTAVPVPLLITLKGWSNHLLRAFTLPPADASLPPLLLYGLLPPLLILLGYSLIYLVRKTPVAIWGMPLLLIGSAFLPLALLDLIRGGQRSLPSRYLIPAYIGILLPLAYLFAAKITQPHQRSRWLWSSLCSLVIGINVWACLSVAQATTAWNKDISVNLLSIATEVNAAPQPLLVSTAFGLNTGTLLALSRYLQPETRLQLIDDRYVPDFLDLPKLPERPGSVFLLNGSLPLRLWLELENKRTATVAVQDLHLTLWRLDD